MPRKGKCSVFFVRPTCHILLPLLFPEYGAFLTLAGQSSCIVQPRSKWMAALLTHPPSASSFLSQPTKRLAPPPFHLCPSQRSFGARRQNGVFPFPLARDQPCRCCCTKPPLPLISQTIFQLLCFILAAAEEERYFRAV